MSRCRGSHYHHVCMNNQENLQVIQLRHCKKNITLILCRQHYILNNFRKCPSFDLKSIEKRIKLLLLLFVLCFDIKFESQTNLYRFAIDQVISTLSLEDVLRGCLYTYS